MYNGKSAQEYRDEAAAMRQRSADSFERCDSDGFVSQWADNVLASEAMAKAALAEKGGVIDAPALFLADGTLASTHYRTDGQYGPYWVLNNRAAEAYGKRFFSPSRAQKAATRRKNNAAKGFTVGTIRVAGHVTLAGGGTGLAGAMSVRPITRPDIDALKAGRFDIIATDDDTD